jgi:L-fucose isomerase-like protein
MMNEKGIIMGCETDITGAIAMYAMYLASGQPSGYLDWNNNYLDDRDKCVCLHCSAFPKSFIGREFEISPTDVLGETLGRDNCFGACKGNVAKGPMTFAKVSTDDTKGRIKAYFGEGEFTDDPITTAGSVAVCKIANLQKLMDYICRNGFEHHIAMNRSNCAGILEEAFSNYMGWEVYHHK